MLNFVILAGSIFVGTFAASIMLVIVLFNIMTSKTYCKKVVGMAKQIEEITDEMYYGEES